MNAGGHIGELTLRRRRAGEPLGAEGPAVEAHAAACAECRARLRALDDQQRRFESEISFDRFAAGVERAARGAAPARRRWAPRLWVAAPTLAMAAAVALVVTFHQPAETTRTKGGAGMTVRVAGPSGQRDARVDGAERLIAGERLRLGYQPGEHHYFLALSIDDRGTVTPLYPERGDSLPISGGGPSATRYLPDSLELTGAGLERILVVLSDRPIALDAAETAARAAYHRAGGDLGRLPPLALPGEQFTRAFAKP